MTPDEVISVLARAALKGCEDGVDLTIWPEWLDYLRDQANIAEKATAAVALNRQAMDPDDLDALKRGALQANFQMAVTGIMALTRFPYLAEIPATEIVERFRECN